MDAAVPCVRLEIGVEAFRNLESDGAITARDVPVGVYDPFIGILRDRHPDTPIPGRGLYCTVHAVELDAPVAGGR